VERSLAPAPNSWPNWGLRALAVGLLLFILLLGLLPDSIYRVLLARGGGLVATGALLVIALRMPVAVRRIWLTFWGYQAITVLADIVFDYQRLTLDELPFPGLADALYLTTYGFGFVGLVMLAQRVSGRSNLEAGIDSAAIGLALLALVGFSLSCRSLAAMMHSTWEGLSL